MQSGDNVQAMRKSLDFIRLGSIIVLLFHFYCVCYPAFLAWGFHTHITDNLVLNMTRGMFFLSGVNTPKLVSLCLLAISLFGEKGKKSDKQTLAPLLYYIGIGILLFFISSLFLGLSMEQTTLAEIYMAVTSLGFFSMMTGGAKLSRLLFLKLGKDVFNEYSETFPQEERLLENEYSVNLPAQYMLKGKLRKSWINIINPFRALLVAGTPGSRRKPTMEKIRKIILRDPACDHATYLQRLYLLFIRFQVPGSHAHRLQRGLEKRKQIPGSAETLYYKFRRSFPLPSLQPDIARYHARCNGRLGIQPYDHAGAQSRLDQKNRGFLRRIGHQLYDGHLLVPEEIRRRTVLYATTRDRAGPN